MATLLRSLGPHGHVASSSALCVSRAGAGHCASAHLSNPGPPSPHLKIPRLNCICKDPSQIRLIRRFRPAGRKGVLGCLWVHISPSLHRLGSGTPDFFHGGVLLSLHLARHPKQQVVRLALKRTHLEPEALQCGECGAAKGSRGGGGPGEGRRLALQGRRLLIQTPGPLGVGRGSVVVGDT